MIPAEFDYTAPDTLEEAIDRLSSAGEDAKLLAGGQSLLPLMKLRFAVPELLVDLGRIPGLAGVRRENGTVRIGAMTTHRALERDRGLGLVSRAAGAIADPQVRNRGTIGGSLAHGDRAADLPGVLLAYEGAVTVRGPSGEREIAARDLFVDYLTTSVAADEVLTEVRLPALDGYGSGFQKFTRRSEDWALVGASALVKARDGACEDVRIALTHVAATPVRAPAVEDALRGRPLDDEHISAAAEQAAEGLDPPADLNADADYKRHLARVLVRRALHDAAGGAG